MIELYFAPTPNGLKIRLFLEEAQLPYRVRLVSLSKGEQFAPAFGAIAPNNRIPAIVDQDGPGGKPFSLFESGAILIYLAGKTGKFLPGDLRARYVVLEWLMFQMASIGPMFGQAHHFRNYAPEKLEYAINRYTNEAGRLYGVMDRRLGESKYLGGNEYTIADIATWPWTRSIRNQGQELASFPNVKRWFEAIEARPAVERGIKVLAEMRREGPPDEKAREILFGATQYQRR